MLSVDMIILTNPVELDRKRTFMPAGVSDGASAINVIVTWAYKLADI